MAKHPADKPESLPDFEASLSEIEQIIDAIEAGEVSLEESLTRYSRGMKLITHCRSILERAESKIKQLTTDAEGKVVEGGEVSCEQEPG
jgi:exodeoxyribonuclease VII small subunit